MLKEYLAELQKTPLLSREEETELWQRYAGGDKDMPEVTKRRIIN